MSGKSRAASRQRNTINRGRRRFIEGIAAAGAVAAFGLPTFSASPGTEPAESASLSGSPRTSSLTRESTTLKHNPCSCRSKDVTPAAAYRSYRCNRHEHPHEVKHFVGNTLSVEQSVWEGRKQTPKTKNARLEVDLHPSVATLLRSFIGHRKDGFIFRSEEGTPVHQSNFLRTACPGEVLDGAREFERRRGSEKHRHGQVT